MCYILFNDVSEMFDMAKDTDGYMQSQAIPNNRLFRSFSIDTSGNLYLLAFLHRMKRWNCCFSRWLKKNYHQSS